MPVYQLLGGPRRSAVACYAHAGGDDLDAPVEDVQRYAEEGYSAIRRRADETTPTVVGRTPKRDEWPLGRPSGQAP